MRISSLLIALATFASSLKAAPPLFPGGGGNYGGILEATFSGDPDDSGILTVVLTDSGASSIKLFWQGQAYALTAAFDEGGQLTKNFPKKNADEKTQLQLFCFLDTSSRTISGVLTDNTAANNGIFSLSGAKPDPTVGPQLGTDLRTGFLELADNKPAQESNVVRGGAPLEIDEDGFALVKIVKSSQRNGRFVGKLPDGTKYSAGSPLRGLQYALRAGLYSQKKKGSGGQLLGLGDVEGSTFARGANLAPRGDDGGAAIVAAFRWHKKRNLPNSTSYPDGIDQRLGLETVHYRANKDLSLVLTGERRSTRNATLRFSDGNLGTDLSTPGPNPFSVGLSVTFFGAKIVGENPFKVKLTVKPLTAKFSGSFRHPDTGETVKFTGAFRSAQGIVPGEGRGNFISFGPQPRDPANAQSGSVRFTLD